MSKEVCSICSGPLDDRFGHNAEPVNRGRCCTTCNNMVVIPARITRLRRSMVVWEATASVSLDGDTYSLDVAYPSVTDKEET